MVIHNSNTVSLRDFVKCVAEVIYRKNEEQTFSTLF